MEKISMAGIYIHVPFCTRICNYCDFYKTGNTKLIPAYTKTLLQEIDYKKSFLADEINTVYFGGGTPSVLPIDDLSDILNGLSSHFNINNKVEITLEVNPDDVSLEYFKEIKALGINRLSIGIQSFNDSILKYLNRRHNSATAKKAIENAQMAGFDNISCDLIYGIQEQELSDFERDLNIIGDYRVTHLSSYHLGIEEGTYFGRLLKNGKLTEIKEELSREFFNLLLDWLPKNGFEHYEVSNFARNQKYSQHNMNYWFNVPYLGLGPSAHSFDGNDRFYNVGNLKKYIDFGQTGIFSNEMDQLNLKDRFNEYMLLRLRTKWGVNLTDIKTQFPYSFLEHAHRIFFKFKDSDYLRIQDENIFLTNEGFFVSDFVVREFFVVD